jgi:hypothetical protein
MGSMTRPTHRFPQKWLGFVGGPAIKKLPVFCQVDGLRGKWHEVDADTLVVGQALAHGVEWGGAAFDPNSCLLYVNSSDMPCSLRDRGSGYNRCDV